MAKPNRTSARNTHHTRLIEPSAIASESTTTGELKSNRLQNEAHRHQTSSHLHSLLVGPCVSEEFIFPFDGNPLQVFGSFGVVNSTIYAPTSDQIEASNTTRHEAIGPDQTTVLTPKQHPSTSKGVGGLPMAAKPKGKSPSRQRAVREKHHKRPAFGHSDMPPAKRVYNGQQKEKRLLLDAEENGMPTSAEQEQGDAQNQMYEVETVLDHVIENGTEIDFTVKWVGYTEPTLVAEHLLQQDCPSLVYRYWNSFGTREKATGIDRFHVFKILRWRVKNKVLHLLIQWVGYPPGQSTWEAAARVACSAKEAMGTYLRTHKGAATAWARECRAVTSGVQ
ncbi:hypothetical protein CDV36_016242 [Fusarium kuroshium]|uniref:Chromo domain-containing protein n=1 Tax=Fusarium kuroshium TaxID=2010991 RepID=A0A3M2QW07_9HYPO|nr:hypothetical protein CDV36_016242 [Fusarium kuroshium]